MHGLCQLARTVNHHVAFLRTVADAGRTAAIAARHPADATAHALRLLNPRHPLSQALKAFVMNPVPKTSGTNHCFIIHEPGKVPKFRCFLRRTGKSVFEVLVGPTYVTTKARFYL